jgi:hypothetical protein
MPPTYLLGEEKKVHSLPSRKREYKRRSWSWWCRKRRGERGRRVSSGEAWNLVALGVHALLVGNVVAPLDSPRSSITGVGAHERKDDRRLAVASLEPSELLLSLHDRPPVTNHVAEARSQWRSSSASPRYRAMPSACSRMRTSAKRKLASNFCCLKLRSIRGRPMIWVSHVPTTA